MPVKAVIIVGGPNSGTEFRPLSMTLPKPLFPIAGRPLIYHHLIALRNIPNLLEVIIIGYYDSSLFRQFIDVSQKELGMKIRYFREFQPLGTGGGLYHFRDQILRNNPDIVFVLHHDVCCDFPLSSMLENHRSKKQSLITIMATKISDRDKAKNYGCLVAASPLLSASNVSIGREEDPDRVLHYVEKPETFISDLINCGVYCLDRRVFQEMDSIIRGPDNDSNASISSLEDVMSLEQDIIVTLVEQGKPIHAFVIKESWCQVKTVNSIIEANRLYLNIRHANNANNNVQSQLNSSMLMASDKRDAPSFALTPSSTIDGNVFIDPTNTIGKQCKIGPNVSIGFGCHIGDGVRIHNSIILNHTTIGDNSIISNAVVGWDSKIGKWSRVEGTPSTNITTILGSDVIVDDERVVRNCVVLPNKEIRNNCHDEIIL